MRVGRVLFPGVIAMLFMAFSTGAEGRELKKAVFAGGCFWCMEAPFEKLDGVTEVISGYTGGRKKNPTYEEVSSGKTGHLEAVQVIYDPAKISYSRLLDVFWRQIDPTDPGGQFVDRGEQYRSAIFYLDQEQKRLAEESRGALERSGRFQRPVVTEIRQSGEFYRAEDYHQDYYKNHSIRYRFYRSRSGRDQFLEKVWGKEEAAMAAEPKTQEIKPKPKYSKPTDEVLKNKLTPLQYKVTRKGGTEKPYDNEYWNEKREGIYVDIVSGEPLFSSLDKYDSGTGWPSFTKPLEPGNIVYKKDLGFFTIRTEVKSKHGDSHLGHVFDDGPPPTGKRYCMNSAALRFVPKEKLAEEGYGEYLRLFEKEKAGR